MQNDEGSFMSSQILEMGNQHTISNHGAIGTNFHMRMLHVPVERHVRGHVLERLGPPLLGILCEPIREVGVPRPYNAHVRHETTRGRVAVGHDKGSEFKASNGRVILISTVWDLDADGSVNDRDCRGGKAVRSGA